MRTAPDPRDTNTQYRTPAVMTILAMALLAGRREIAEIARFATTLSQTQRRRLGLPLKKGARALHLWQGDFANRQGESRHIRLSGEPFDPFTDIAPDENGCWRWASAKPHLHEYVRSYFTRRREDG